jgi:hypothetical protein
MPSVGTLTCRLVKIGLDRVKVVPADVLRRRVARGRGHLVCSEINEKLE